jgi:hypothetical protein
MIRLPWVDRRARLVMGALMLSLVPAAALAQAGFPSIPLWAYPGAYQGGPGDTIVARPRTTTLRWMRDPAAEARPDFGGYRIYRVVGRRDTSNMVLIRRFSLQRGDSTLLWHLSQINAGTPLPDRIATFIDPDSSGAFVKQCRLLNEQGLCASPGDSVFRLIAPPGPHDGFRTWYTITYEARNITDNDYLDLFIPDLANCVNPSIPSQCPNLNRKETNLTVDPIEPTPGPTADLERVAVVPNPFRANEAWDAPGGNEVHFINLPSSARIRIYTLAGDLVRELSHNDPVRDFERWDLKNESGRNVSSGVYVYRVESQAFSFQDRFVVIR